MNKKKVLLVPLDPVHDIGLKLIKKGLDEAGHETRLLPPDLPLEEVVKAAVETKADTILVSRTLGYGVAEILARFVDTIEAAGIRDRVVLGLGGMAIRPELAAELGFDAGFGPQTTVEEAVAFVEGREYRPATGELKKEKQDLTAGYDYFYHHSEIGSLLGEISQSIINWARGKTSPGILRAQARDELWDYQRWLAGEENSEFSRVYPDLCGELARNYYRKKELHPKTRLMTSEEVSGFQKYLQETKKRMKVTEVRHSRTKPVVLNQYGTGCPVLDVGHIHASEAWGADGVIHFDPSWGARTEGFLEGFITHQEDGTVITAANLHHIRQSLQDSTLWQVRAHRGLNTAETVVLAGKIGADLTKINFCYGSLGAGTDPERLVADAYHGILYAVKYKLPFDVVTNEELCGVPAHKAFAGMLIVSDLAVRLGGRPILQPLFCYSPEVMLGGQMVDNYIDFNAAKVYALRQIIRAPIWPGAPIGFLTQSEDRVQSSMTTALHSALAASLEVDAISIASSDEAYSGGPISVPAKIDTLRAVKEAFRFFGQASIEPTEMARKWAEELVIGIHQTLKEVAKTGDIVRALYDGLLGSREEGAYPGRAGRGTVRDL